MIKVDVAACKHLFEFYEHLTYEQEKAHGITYSEVHRAIKRYMYGVKIYKEIGVNQGTSLAGAILNGEADTYIGVDHNLANLEREDLFRDYIAALEIYEEKPELRLLEADSLSEVARGECDLLYLDSKHTPGHLYKELRFHSPDVSRTIIVHDTHAKRLYSVIEEFVRENTSWYIRENYPTGVGYTVIQRYENER